MSYTSQELIPNDEVAHNYHTVFKNVRSASIKKSRRKRECFACGYKIEKGYEYVNHEFRYDYRIITVSFHTDCYQ